VLVFEEFPLEFTGDSSVLIHCHQIEGRLNITHMKLLRCF